MQAHWQNRLAVDCAQVAADMMSPTHSMVHSYLFFCVMLETLGIPGFPETNVDGIRVAVKRYRQLIAYASTPDT